jgi:hypothetical protein
MASETLTRVGSSVSNGSINPAARSQLDIAPQPRPGRKLNSFWSQNRCRSICVIGLVLSTLSGAKLAWLLMCFSAWTLLLRTDSPLDFPDQTITGLGGVLLSVMLPGKHPTHSNEKELRLKDPRTHHLPLAGGISISD